MVKITLYKTDAQHHPIQKNNFGIDLLQCQNIIH